MAEQKAAQIIQVRSRESFVHRFHGDGGPREVEIFEEEIRHAWADEPSITEAQKVALVRKYLGCSVKDELACYPAKFTAEPEALLATLRRAYDSNTNRGTKLQDRTITELEVEERLSRVEENEEKIKKNVEEIRKKMEETKVENQEMFKKILQKLEEPTQTKANRNDRQRMPASIGSDACFICGRRDHFARECRENTTSGRRQGNDRPRQ
ncbi:hypothetical protein EGW08_014561 [Elysia chlorotica]|uniref:CCHC-type domain-containing protein n=1 Tax=Elysia chlorotica TaxID=188477 RepID=A0A3S0ZFH9_ELYCH|nr:hypothetical protein EGW08_014561 [Elysia chlorotica]